MTLVDGSEPDRLHALRALYDAHSENACVLCFEEHLPFFEGCRTRSLGKDSADCAHRLFALLREMDGMNVTHIFAEASDTRGIGLAVMNRMARAAGFDILQMDRAHTDKDSGGENTAK